MSGAKLLARFRLDYGCMGDLDGVFVTTQAALDAAYGKDFYMSDVLGKHSEITDEFSDSYIEIIDCDPQFIDVFESLLGEIGVNPLDYIQEDEEEEDA